MLRAQLAALAASVSALRPESPDGEDLASVLTDMLDGVGVCLSQIEDAEADYAARDVRAEAAAERNDRERGA